MEIEVFKSHTDKDHKFAVAVPAGKTMMMIQTYETMEQLETGYREWQKYASSRNITPPYPIELLDSSGNCKVLSEFLEARE